VQRDATAGEALRRNLLWEGLILHDMVRSAIRGYVHIGCRRVAIAPESAGIADEDGGACGENKAVVVAYITIDSDDGCVVLVPELGDRALCLTFFDVWRQWPASVVSRSPCKTLSSLMSRFEFKRIRQAMPGMTP
jgi:hypothetical protein